MDPIELTRILDALDRAESSAIGIPTLSSRHCGLSVDDAWAVARGRDQRRAARGEVRVGYKLGWTSAAMRQALGIDQPNYGSLWSQMATDGTLSMATRIHPKAEPEFAYRPLRDLAGDDITAEEVAEAGEWAVSLEVVDPRWNSYGFTFADNTADGSSAAAYAIGEFRSIDVAPEELRLTMRIDGDEERSATGADVFDSPAESVAFLVQSLAAENTPLRAGMIVLTGGATAPVDLKVGMVLEVESPELGACRLEMVP
ncbi:MAG: hypothetical protein Q4G46_07825 [Propionibacteriaceae bacterium]|nr:hypothetical protein [Propionibacteriaceae bacterium]